MGKYFTYDTPSGPGRVETPKNYDDSKDWEYKKNRKLPTQEAIKRLADEALANDTGYKKSVVRPYEKNAKYKGCGLTYKELQKYKVPLTDEERSLVMKRKAVWHHGPNGEATPAVWKSVNPKTGKTTYVTNTHRAMNTAPSIKGAIGRYHTFISKTAGLNDIYQEDIKPIAKYLWYLLKHKYEMVGPGLQVGVDPWTLAKHDYSKLRPSSIDTYGKFFFGPKKYRNNPEFYTKFREAAEQHYQDEDHHNYRVGKPVSIDNQLESVLDWYSVNKSTGSTKLEFENWYKLNRDKFLSKLYPETIKLLDEAVQKERSWWNIF